MMALSWNVRGLGHGRPFLALHDLVKSEMPNLVFLMEIKKDQRGMEVIRQKLGYKGGIFVDSEGRSGGLTLLWDDKVDVSLRSVSKFHIDCLIKHADSTRWWHWTGFYGDPRKEERKHSWQLLTRLAMEDGIAWCVMGDFNAVLSNVEKEGGRGVPYNQIEGFARALGALDLEDLGYYGNQFTWSNNQADEDHIREILDRVVANLEWRNMFNGVRVNHLAVSTSDHSPLQVIIEEETPRQRRRMNRRFQFESAWLEESPCREEIFHGWAEGDSRVDINTRLKQVENMLHTWNKEVFGSIRQRLKWLRKELRCVTHSKKVVYTKQVKEEINILLAREEEMWRQRSRIEWLRKGDRDTTYFHRKAIARRARNAIMGQEDTDGTCRTDDEDITQVLESHFSELFTTSNPSIEQIEGVTGSIRVSIGEATSRNLDRPIEDWEVEEALRKMGPTKAPGVDGFSPIFYQSMWDVVGRR